MTADTNFKTYTKFIQIYSQTFKMQNYQNYRETEKKIYKTLDLVCRS